MTFEIALIFALLLGVVVLFATERMPVDIITLLALSVLVGCRVLSPGEAFSGFGSELVVMLASIFVLGGSLQYTGVLTRVADGMLKLAGGGSRRLTVLLMGATGSLSAFMNNTTVAAMMVPPTTGLARRAGVSASKLLMPLAFAAILGGTCTLIGTSTNIAVSGYLTRTGHDPLGLFELLPIGLALMAAGILFMVLLGSRLLPDHEDDAFTESAERRNYFAEVEVLPNSPLVGETAFDWELSLVGFRLIQIVRGGKATAADALTKIEPGDRLIVEGKVDNLRKILTIEGLVFASSLDPGELGAGFPGADITMSEAIVLPGSELSGMTLEELEFRHRYGLAVLAVNSGGRPVFEKLGEVRLREGDVVLLHGPADRVDALRRRGSKLQPLGDEEIAGDEAGSDSTGSRKGWGSLAIFVGAIVAGTTGLIPMAGAFLAGAVLVVLSGCVPAEKAREFIDWRLLILVGGMTAFGTAMEKSGAAELLAGWVVAALSPMGITAVLAGFLLLTILLTQPMSNAAAALVVLPVAMSAAASMGLSERTFGIGVMLAASVSFIAPLEPACLLVYGAGKYRMVDFFKVGGLLTLILTVVILLLLPIFWSLR